MFASLVKLLSIGAIYYFIADNPHFFIQNFLLNGLWVLTVYVAVFSLFEKAKKEAYVINYTNSKSRKILLSLFNSSPFPICVVTKEGAIIFCNAQFEKMLFQRLHIRAIPPTVFKLTNDEDSLVKIK